MPASPIRSTSALSAEACGADRAYVINTATYMTTDEGKTFVPVKGAPGGDDYHQLWINPKNSNRMVLSSDQGTVVSVDGAKTWSTWYNQPTAREAGSARDAGCRHCERHRPAHDGSLRSCLHTGTLSTG